MAPLPTRVTAALANASEQRSIAFEYQQTPVYYKPVTVEVPLDEKGCLRGRTAVYGSANGLS